MSFDNSSNHRDPCEWNDHYNHANEVVYLAPFLFNRVGAPWPTQ